MANLFFLGKLYRRLADYDKSLSDFQRALKLEQTDYNIRQEPSLAATYLNKTNIAIEFFEEALRRNPDNFIILGNHSMSLLIAGFDDKTLEIINKAISLNLNPTDIITKSIKC